jgi:SAM-dependent methyltransferase
VSNTPVAASPAPPAWRVQPSDDAYREQAAAEAQFWSRTWGFGIDRGYAAHPNDPFQTYTNRRFMGDPHKRWSDEIREYGSFRRGLTLGASGISQDAAILEQNPGLHMTICDISEPALASWESALVPQFGDRVDVRVLDLNFGALEDGAYDLIVSSSTLHHVMNLEHAAWQINRALAPGGLFFMQDYAGENRRQFSNTKKRLFELLYERDVQRHPDRVRGLHWKTPDEMVLSPFCAVRSQDVLPVLAEYLEPVKVRTAGSLITVLMDVRPAHILPRRQIAHYIERLHRRARLLLNRPLPPVKQRFLDELALVGDVLEDAGVILPADAYGVYRKRVTSPIASGGAA